MLVGPVVDVDVDGGGTNGGEEELTQLRQEKTNLSAKSDFVIIS